MKRFNLNLHQTNMNTDNYGDVVLRGQLTKKKLVQSTNWKTYETPDLIMLNFEGVLVSDGAMG